jgi:hypothetical protein
MQRGKLTVNLKRVYVNLYKLYIVNLIWGRNGFDGIVETWVAGRGFSLAS